MCAREWLKPVHSSDTDPIVPFDPVRSGTRSKRSAADRTVNLRDGLTQSESTSYLTEHITRSSAAASHCDNSIDLSKAFELIRFVGCETHHQLQAALQMLVPHLINEEATTQFENRPRHNVRNFAVDRTCSPLSYRHPDVDHVLCSVVEMYAEKKLASRSKKKKDSEKGRHEVGRKLKIIENEVCWMTVSLICRLLKTSTSIVL